MSNSYPARDSSTPHRTITRMIEPFRPRPGSELTWPVAYLECGHRLIPLPGCNVGTKVPCPFCPKQPRPMLRSEQEIREALDAVGKALSFAPMLGLDELGGFLGAEDTLRWALGDTDVAPAQYRHRPDLHKPQLRQEHIIRAGTSLVSRLRAEIRRAQATESHDACVPASRLRDHVWDYVRALGRIDAASTPSDPPLTNPSTRTDKS